MRTLIKSVVFCIFSAVLIIGCGSKGSSPASKATTRVSLFGTMSSGSKIATVQATLTVPSGILVNYTSPVGATTGTYPLRKGVIVPSGPLLVSAADFSTSSYTIETRTLRLNFFNQGRLPLVSSTTGDGTELATLNFTLATPGTTATMPVQDLLVLVGQEKPNMVVDYLSGCKLNYNTSYQ